MTAWAWLLEYSYEALETAGIIGALIFSGMGARRESRTRRAETLVEITKQHREIWQYYDDTPELWPLLEKERSMHVNPLTAKEGRFANQLSLHLRATFYARKASIYTQPQYLEEDIKNFFSFPAPRAAWELMKTYYDAEFVRFVERTW